MKIHLPKSRVLACVLVLTFLALSVAAEPSPSIWKQTASLAAPEAVQAAAADEKFIYAIASQAIAKYDRATGERIAISEGDATHLNSGFLHAGKLYSAHSNYPRTPEVSEIKVLDPATMRLATFHDFGSIGGSLTWCVRKNDHWWCNFARYGEDNTGTFLAEFDDQWRELSRWTYPAELIAQIGAYSLSGGVWSGDDLLTTDHDHAQLYRLRLPKAGSVLELVATEPAPFTGQGIAVDTSTGGLVGINRAKQQVVFAQAPKAAAAKHPNIVIILVDDMGFSDIGCYGSEIPTPNLDALAADGLRFTQFYNTGRCCPTRATLLTGLYAHQTGVGHMTGDYGTPGYRGRLNDECLTLAEAVAPAGYFTAMSGKWHVGFEHGVTPWGRGFERNLNAPAGGFYFQDSPRTDLYFGDKHVKRTDDPLPKEWYSTDLWTQFGLQFIDDAIAAKRPFLLYLAHNAPHFPLQAPDEDIARFRGKYKAGWDKLREARHAKQIDSGLVDKAWPMAPRPDGVSAWDKLSPEEQDRFDHIMAIYAACVYTMDRSIGTLVAGLKDRGQYDNTLILFMSDNGGNAESGPNGKFEGDHPGDSQSNVFCGESWAWMQNTPFRRYKHYNHEGGIATPLIAHWPAGIKAHGDRSQPCHLIDIMATCVDVSGAKYPTVFNGHKITPLEGRSLVPAFANQPIERDAIYWEHEGNAAVRVDDWKLVRLGQNGPWELYNLKTDRTEQHNLAAEMPEKAKELRDKWRAWAERCYVLDKGMNKGGGKGKKAKNKAKS